ncbi:MAG TPA: ankyrin repeat domain-containing protein, partial [Candidatus Krumholzibacterium sp.]|nr:ankyrin repeat domain-containing protein [Candidatus Krumholzibacterium sp.]
MNRSVTSIAGLLLLVIPFSSMGQSIYEAARNGDLESVISMENAAPSIIGERNDEGETPLLYAAYGGSLEVVKYLVSRGMGVDIPAFTGETPLHYAAYAGHEDVVRTLLDSGAAIGAKNIEGNTPLHYAALSGKEGTMTLLLERGAVINERNFYGYTPLDFAEINGSTAGSDLLASRGGEFIEIRAPEAVRLSGNVIRILFPFGDLSNIGLSMGREGLLLVDTGCSARATGELEHALKKIGGGELRYLVNTHLHRDHIAGNGIAGENTVVIDFNSLDSLATAGTIERGRAPLTGTGGGSFDTWYWFRFNGEVVRLIPHPGIHTDADIMVHFTGSGVVHAGDLIISQSFPSVRDNTDLYLKFLDTVIDVFPGDTRFICG